MKFGQSIKYNMRSIFTQYGAGTFLRPFSKISELSKSLDQQSIVLYSLLILYAKVRAIVIIETKLQTTCFYLM